VRGETKKGRLGARAQRDVAVLAADRAAATPNLRVSFSVWGRYVRAGPPDCSYTFAICFVDSR